MMTFLSGKMRGDDIRAVTHSTRYLKPSTTLAWVALGCLAAGPWMFFSAPAQSLPRLNAHALSNRTLSISWPYTNSGFVLQESSGLPAASNWQSSSSWPAFDSNSAVFSVIASATNVTKFFRLKQPADLRGIYLDSNALPISSNSAAALAASFGVPGVDGLVLVMSWKNLETNLNQYDWSDLDNWMTNATAANLKVDLSLRAGDLTPKWLFHSPASGGAGATPLTFSFSPNDGQSNICQTAIIAAPWDTNFLVVWDGMLTAVSNHLKSNGTYDAVKLLRLTGINRNSDELHLPAQTTNSTGAACVSNAPAIWQAAGYTPSNLLSGWSNILFSFKTHFPDKSFSVAIIALTNVNPFPPIDDNGVITNIVPADQNRPLLALAGQLFRGRLVIQNNSLYPDKPAMSQTIQSAQSLGTLIAFQTNENGPGASADCEGACSNATYLAMLERGIYPLNQTNDLRAQYIEVFAADALAFTNAIWQAHQALFAPP
jgi:hypothetical protein